MNEITVKENERIENLIFEVRGVQVMLDSDLARLYECANGTKSINLAVKRHINRFPERFMFQLTEEESKMFSRSQTGTLKGRGHNIKYLPYVFTEQGVAMLATVLRTPVAEEISIKIMDAFVAMRKYISSNFLNQNYINSLVLENQKMILTDHNLVIENKEKIKALEETFKQFEEKKKVNDIYFDGQIYDAYSKVLEIFKEAKTKLTIIDSYDDNTMLNMISRLNANVLLIAGPKLLTQQDINTYNQQYNNLTVKYNTTFHDRYFILDDSIVYHCGASINRIGHRTFSINLLQDKEIIDLLINKVNSII